MSERVFARPYADAYDAIYADKNYARECDLIESAIHRFGSGQYASILDLGCGTGGHALELAKRKYAVTGLDQSAAMIEIAKRKSTEAGIDLSLHVGDVRSTRISRTFDAALLMFAVLGYQTSNADVLATLRNARRHLRAAGILVFDVWYGVPVLSQGPIDRFRVINEGARQLLRAVSPQLRPEQNIVDVRIRTWDLRGDRVEAHSDEIHPMRYFFPQELEALLADAGFDVGTFCAFPDLETPPDPLNWNLGCVAVAAESIPA